MPHAHRPPPPGARRRAQRRAARHRLHGDGLGHAGRGPRSRPDRGPGQRPGAVGGPGVRLAADLHRPGAGPTAVRRGSPNLPGIKQKLTDYLNGIITGLQQSRAQLGAGRPLTRRRRRRGRGPHQRRAGQAGDRHPARPRRRSTRPTRTTRRGSSPRSPTPRPSWARSRAGRARRPQRVPAAAEGRSEGGQLPAALGAGQQPAGLTGAVRSRNACSTVRPVSSVSQLSLFSAEARAAADGRPRGPAVRSGPDRALRLRRHRAAVGRAAPTPAARPPSSRTCAAVGIDAERGRHRERRDRGAHRVPPRPRRPARRLDDRARSRRCPRECSSTGPCCGCGCSRPAGGTVAGVELLLDPHAPQTHLALIAAATRAGISPARSGRGTALRITGSPAHQAASPSWSVPRPRALRRTSGRRRGWHGRLTARLRSRPSDRRRAECDRRNTWRARREESPVRGYWRPRGRTQRCRTRRTMEWVRRDDRNEPEDRHPADSAHAQGGRRPAFRHAHRRRRPAARRAAW